MKTNSLKSVVIAVVAGAFLASLPAFGLPQTELQTISKTLAVAKVVEVPAKAVTLVSGATKETKNEVAAAVVSSAIKAHPSAISSVIIAVLKVAPETTEVVVKAALEVAPNSALTIVAAAAEGAPEQSEKAVALASAKNPSRTIAFEREVSVVKGRRAVSSAAALEGGVVTQTPRTGGVPIPVYATPGGVR